MDSESILKKAVKLISLFLVVILLSIANSGCDLRAGRYPFQVATEWLCNDPHFLLSYAEDESGRKSEELTWRDETIAVDIMFGTGDYCVYPSGSLDYEDRLFTGLWDYRNENLVLYINEDFIFDKQYTELVFLSSDTA